MTIDDWISKITKCVDIHWRKIFQKIKIIWNVKACDFMLKKKFKVSKCSDYHWLKKKFENIF